MNKKFTIFLVIAIAIIIGIGGYLYFSSKNKNSEEPSYETSRTSTNENSQSNTSSNNATSNDTTSSNTASNNTTNQNTSENITSPEALEPETKTEVKETEIASFTTKIYSKNDSDRQNNLTVSCSTLNDTIVENGSTFSFCGTLGKTSDNKGYEKATVFKDGKIYELWAVVFAKLVALYIMLLKKYLILILLKDTIIVAKSIMFQRGKMQQWLMELMILNLPIILVIL